MNTTLPEIIQQYVEALHRKDWQRFESCLHADFNYCTDGGIRQNREQFLRFMRANDWNGIEYSLEALRTITSNDDTLLVSVYRSHFKGRSHGETLQFSAVETTVLHCDEGTWTIVHSHASNEAAGRVG